MCRHTCPILLKHTSKGAGSAAKLVEMLQGNTAKTSAPTTYLHPLESKRLARDVPVPFVFSNRYQKKLQTIWETQEPVAVLPNVLA